MKIFKVTIKGITPLLFNKPAEYGFDSAISINLPLQTQQQAEKESINKLYSINGCAYQPSTHIWACLIEAGKDLKIKGKGKATYSKMLASMVEVSPEAIFHKQTNFDIFAAMTVNPTTKGRHMTYRPRLKEWELDFDLIVDDEIPDEIINNALSRAGRYVGIGDWRPAKKGIHGKFIVTKCILAV